MKFLLIVFLSFLIINPANAFNLPFKKKQTPQTPKMVETKQEWEQEARNVPLKERKLETQKEPESDKKNYFPKPHYVFEKYNYPAGKRDYDIRFIKKNLVEHPIMVADKECRYVAYANYYYRADIDQIYSDFYVEKLDTTKNKTRRILEYNHKQLKRTPVLLSGFREQYKNLFNGLSIVDWDSDGKKVLIKERIGSTLGGIYRTNLYVYFLDEEKTIKLSELNNSINNYFTDTQNINFIQYRSNIEPFGFSDKDDNVIVFHLYMYQKDGQKVFMGTWGYNLEKKQTIILSKTNPSISISANGLVLKRVLE